MSNMMWQSLIFVIRKSSYIIYMRYTRMTQKKSGAWHFWVYFWGLDNEKSTLHAWKNTQAEHFCPKGSACPISSWICSTCPMSMSVLSIFEMSRCLKFPTKIMTIEFLVTCCQNMPHCMDSLQPVSTLFHCDWLHCWVLQRSNS